MSETVTRPQDRLSPETCALLVIDWQEKLVAAMDEERAAFALRQATTLRWLADTLQMPIVGTEQYPQGLGPTVPALAVGDPVAKVAFSACDCAPFVERLDTFARPTVLVVGMETHICVAQTTADLLRRGKRVVVAADATLSRRQRDGEWGLRRMERDGADVRTVEAIAFELVGSAGSTVFKELSRRVR